MSSPPEPSVSSTENATSPVMPQAVLVVDDDEMITTLLGDYLTTLGITQIDIALDGDRAWQLIKEKTFQLIVLDWKLPGIMGLALFNRIRQIPHYATVPICISSGLLTREDCFLLEEYPTTILLEKPYTEEIFLEGINKLILESQWRQENLTNLNSLFSDLTSGSSKTFSQLQQILKSSPNPMPIVIEAAKILRQYKHYVEAESLLMKILERDKSSILALSELGKVLYCQKRLEDAYKVLLKTQSISPKNIQRLCLLGEIDLSLGKPDAAAQHFKKALLVDGDDEKAKAGMISAENISSLPADQRKPLHMMQSMAAILNMTAISLIKNDEYEKAIEQYQAAFQFIDDDIDKAKIAFNLGLGFIRWHRQADAKVWLQKSLDYSQGTFNKARHYLDQLAKGGIDSEIKKQTELEETTNIQ